MIRILLDECLDVKLKYRFQECNSNFQVSTVADQRWTGIKNGKLLPKAQQEFDVFVTIDQNLSYQQVLSSFSIAIIVLKATSNRYGDLLELVKPSSEAIESAKAGKLYEIASEIYWNTPNSYLAECL
jgi:hypothetical protein